MHGRNLLTPDLLRVYCDDELYLISEPAAAVDDPPDNDVGFPKKVSETGETGSDEGVEWKERSNLDYPGDGEGRSDDGSRIGT